MVGFSLPWPSLALNDAHELLRLSGDWRYDYGPHPRHDRMRRRGGPRYDGGRCWTRTMIYYYLYMGLLVFVLLIWGVIAFRERDR